MLDLLRQWRKSTVPASWRLGTRSKEHFPFNVIYAISCFFYVLPLSTWHDGELMGRRMPLLAHLGFAKWIPPYWLLQGWLSFWSDWLDFGEPAWSHAIDILFATGGSYLVLYILVWEQLDVWCYFFGICSAIHATIGFGLSRYYRRVEADLRKFLVWHTIWHTAFPSWVTVWGYYWLYHMDDGSSAPTTELYPNVLLSFYMPLLVAFTFIYSTRPRASGDRIENQIGQVEQSQTQVAESGSGGSPSKSRIVSAGRRKTSSSPMKRRQSSTRKKKVDAVS
ncbi:unnamed protein product [Amoebophrya sp. A25]|nr:unnamed protein product [Amoebophrya sp. A25]|eukprot:GSA25T00026255001.1